MNKAFNFSFYSSTMFRLQRLVLVEFFASHLLHFRIALVGKDVLCNLSEYMKQIIIMNICKT